MKKFCLRACLCIGLSINEDKTKYIKIKRMGIKNITHLKIDNFAFEIVEKF